MADKDDRRGGSRGGPRGGRGRGGRGGSRGDRGDRGGGRGGYSAGRGSDPQSDAGRGGSYEPRGRGRGDGGRARGFQGGFGGPGRGSGPDRGRGDFRGGRGRGRGRGGFQPSGSRDPAFFSYDGVKPEADQDVAALEQQIVDEQTSSMQELVASMGKLKMSAKAKPSALAQDQFPVRPAYGTNGVPVVLWANYYRVAVKLGTLYKYTISVNQVVGEQQPKDKGKGKPKGAAGPQSKEVKGRKLYFVIREILGELTKADPSLVLATEFKSQLVSLSAIQFQDNPMKLSMPSPNNPEKLETFEVTFHGPIEASVENMMKYLTSSGTPKPSPETQGFPIFQSAVDALNVIFGFGPRSRDDISAVGSSRFFLFKDGGIAADLTSKGRPLLAARGFFQSVRLGTGRLLLNTNVTHGVFKLSGKVKDIFDGLNIYPVQKTDYRGKKQLRTFSKFLPKTRVWVEMMLSDGKKIRRPKAIHSLASSLDVRRSRTGANMPRFDPNWEYPGPKHVQFWLEMNGAESHYITVFDYYKQKYGLSLGDYPLLNLGTADRPTFFPAEFVEIQPGQSVKAKLLSEETVSMLNFACRSPYANAFSITNEGRDTLGLDDGSLDRFGISVDKRLLVVDGRVLSSPGVTYMQKKIAEPFHMKPEGASWNLRDVKVFKPGNKINRWTFVNVLAYRSAPVDRKTVEDFARFMSNMGININTTPQTPPTTEITDTDVTTKNVLDEYFQWAKKNKIEFILFILGSKEADVYNRIKLLGDCVYGIHTSCVQGSHKLFGGGSPGYFANVALKWNLKAGGVNHKLSQELDLTKTGRTMVVGYDVTHPTNMPTGKSDEIPSLVGLVSSIDRDMGQWPSISWEQSSKQEMLSDQLVEAFKSRLQLWQKHNKGFLPENIVIFRDGVSEGQFFQVLEKELPLIRAACTATSTKIMPRFTIVVSVKRHQTRFYPTDSVNLPAHKNIQNGTVVDRGVTQARVWDFFLTAHSAIKGTARPAHYTVLLDEIFRPKYQENAANELEKFTHELCYLYGRATKAVSICPPAYYADIVCTRARTHRPEYADISDTESVITAGPGSSAGGSKYQVHENLRDTMYYI